MAIAIAVPSSAQPTFSASIGATMHNYFMTSGITGEKKNFSSNSNGIFIEVAGAFPVSERLDVTGALKGTLTGLGKKGVNFLQYRGLVVAGSVESEKMTFLEIPFNVKYNFGSRMNSHFFVAAGPALSFWLSYHEKYEDMMITINTDVFKEMKGYINKFNVGAGVSLGIEAARLRLSLGYDYYFLNLFTSSMPSVKAYRGQARVGIAYLFY